MIRIQLCCWRIIERRESGHRHRVGCAAEKGTDAVDADDAAETSHVASVIRVRQKLGKSAENRQAVHQPPAYQVIRCRSYQGGTEFSVARRSDMQCQTGIDFAGYQTGWRYHEIVHAIKIKVHCLPKSVPRFSSAPKP